MPSIMNGKRLPIMYVSMSYFSYLTKETGWFDKYCGHPLCRSLHSLLHFLSIRVAVNFRMCWSLGIMHSVTLQERPGESHFFKFDDNCIFYIRERR